MKKLLKYLMMFVCVISLFGCTKDDTTIRESRTIVLEVNSEVTPVFTSNFGTGTYDETSKKYTHTIDYIKDLYIFMSYEDLKTVTVYIPTSDMQENIITKQVTFGDELDAEIEITVEGVKTLEGIEIVDASNYSNLVIGKKNKFKLTVPSREMDYNISFTLPGYKNFDINIAKEKLISGNTKVTTMAITNSQVYVAIEGNSYSYKVYSMTTNALVASGNNYSNQSGTQYVLLENNDAYYISLNSSRKGSILQKIPMNENVTIDAGKYSYEQHYGYFYIDSGNEWISNWYIYNKVTETIKNSSSIETDLENLGLLVRTESNQWKYIDDVTSASTTNDWEYRYTLDYTNAIDINFNLTKVDYVSKEIVSQGIVNDIGYLNEVKSTLEDGTFSLTIECIESGTLNFDLVDKSGNKVTSISRHIESYFKGDVHADTIKYEGKTIPYTVPIFVEDLVYEDGEYTYPSQIIDTNMALTSIMILDSDGYINSLGENDFLMDEEQDIIMPTVINGVGYYDIKAGETYNFKYNSKTWTLTPSQKDIDSGHVLVMSESAPTVKFMIPEGYKIIITSLYNMEFTPNSEGFANVPVRTDAYIEYKITNGIVTMDAHKQLTGSDIYEIQPFFVLNDGYIMSGNDYNVNIEKADDGTIYALISVFNAGAIVERVCTSLMEKRSDGSNWNYEVNISDFVYDSELKANYYDASKLYDHVITYEESYVSQYIKYSETVMDVSYYDENLGKWNYIFYVSNGTTIYTYENSDSYVITEDDADRLILGCEGEWGNYEITVRPE